MGLIQITRGPTTGPAQRIIDEVLLLSDSSDDGDGEALEAYVSGTAKAAGKRALVASKHVVNSDDDEEELAAPTAAPAKYVSLLCLSWHSLPQGPQPPLIYVFVTQSCTYANS